MNTTISGGLIRLVAGPVAAAIIIGGAVGLASVANAHTAAHPIGGGVGIGLGTDKGVGNGKWYYHAPSNMLGDR
jgi:hypothetical protein